MKNLFTCLALVITVLGFSQSKTVLGEAKGTTKVENISITITVDSLKEFESTFNIEDIKEILDMSDANETISFKIVCNGETMSNGKKSHMSYAIEGNSDEPETFLKGVEKIRNSAIKYYTNKQ